MRVCASFLMSLSIAGSVLFSRRGIIAGEGGNGPKGGNGRKGKAGSGAGNREARHRTPSRPCFPVSLPSVMRRPVVPIVLATRAAVDLDGRVVDPEARVQFAVDA